MEKSKAVGGSVSLFSVGLLAPVCPVLPREMGGLVCAGLLQTYKVCRGVCGPVLSALVARRFSPHLLWLRFWQSVGPTPNGPAVGP